MPTVGEAVKKISELHSRVAVLQEMQTYLETHFLSSDGGGPEQRITREDLATVPETHIQANIAFLEGEIEQTRGELEHWEALLITDPSVQARNMKGKPHGLASKRSNPASPDAAEHEGG